MKNLIQLALLFLLSSTMALAQQDSTGLAGDHFSLQGALNLFSKASNIEEFEKNINAESNAINNLDLNEDGNTDYIQVEDIFKDNAHAIVMRVAVNEGESQDIAVIEVEKTGNEIAQAQIVGDEELYGTEMYYEPMDEKSSGGRGGPTMSVETIGIIVNVWMWPSVQFIYSNGYRPWVSPWRWGYYPPYWKPWKHVGWRTHWRNCNHYNGYYHRSRVHRCKGSHAMYVTHRVSSKTVHTRYKSTHEKQHAGKKVDKVSPGKTSSPDKTIKQKNTQPRVKKVNSKAPASGKSPSKVSKPKQSPLKKGTGGQGKGGGRKGKK